MCSIVPLSMDDLSVLLHRKSKSFKNKNIKVLLETKQLFYWIPEMINHPQQNMLLTLRWREVIARKIIAISPWAAKGNPRGILK